MVHGTPCWYELSTSAGKLEAAQAFYTKVFDWQCGSAEVPGFEYRLAEAGGDLVAGLMVMPANVANMPPMWMIYYAVDDCDRRAQEISRLGGRIHRVPADIPGTGRFAIAGDPTGAGFGILQPLPMADGQAGGHAFDQMKPGHGNWHELMSPDPTGALEFYGKLFGWQKSRTVDMGAMGTYQLFAHGGKDIGGMMGLGNAPMPSWLPYFGTTGVDAAVERIRDAGGTLVHGPMEVPGGAFVAIARDPQCAAFAVVGPKADG